MERVAAAHDEHLLADTVLRIEELDKDLYRGHHVVPPGSIKVTRIYGGRLVGQALEAATRTVATTLLANSVHTYFVRPGDLSIPVIYRVLRLRDGQSFATRSVLASQRGRPIAIVMASFHIHEPSSFEHQHPMPAVPPPESLDSTEVCLNEVLPEATEAAIDEIKMTASEALYASPFVTKKCPVHDTGVKEARMLMWLKLRDPIPSSHISHHLCLLAFMSDAWILPTAVIPHTQFQLGMMTSLDHTLWFHCPVRADEWLLYDTYSPKAVNNRALITGRLYKRDGTLAVTVVQEGLIRSKL